MDLTGFMFFIIEQSVNNAMKPSISPNFESKGDHMKVACDDRLPLSEAEGSTVRLRPNRTKPRE